MVSAEESSSPVPGALAARLSAAQIDLLRPHGAERATARGEVLFREGDRSYDFLVILAGTVAAVDGFRAAERELGVGYPGDFMAELNLFTGERLYTTAVVREPGAVLVVPVSDLREQIAAHPDLGDVIMPVLLARRQWLAQHQAGFQIIGSRYSPDTARLREFATRNRLPHSFVELDRDPYSQVVELGGDVSLQDALVEDHRSGLRRRVDARAMFVLIGAEPHTGWLAGSARLDGAGFVLTGDALGASIRDAEPWHALGRGPYPLETSLPGMFAAGDVRADSVRRVGSAVGDGSLAAQLVHEWLGSSRGSQVARWYGARTRRPT